MKRICAWCGKHLGDTLGHSDLVTHGICEPCAAALQSGCRESIAHFLDTLRVPVMVIDSSTRVLAINRSARTVLGHTDHLQMGMLPGNVLRCVNARKPGGCGHTRDCQACVIRNSVESTFTAGTPVERMPASQEVIDSGQSKTVKYLISTQKVDGVVLLRIDEVERVQKDKVTVDETPNPSGRSASQHAHHAVPA